MSGDTGGEGLQEEVRGNRIGSGSIPLKGIIQKAKNDFMTTKQPERLFLDPAATTSCSFFWQNTTHIHLDFATCESSPVVPTAVCHANGIARSLN